MLQAFKSVLPLLEADRIRRKIQTLYLQFQGPSHFEAPKCDTVQDQRSMFCFAVFLPCCSKQSASYENHHNTSSVLSAPKTGYSIVPHYNKSFTPFYICNRVFGCIWVFLCVLVLLVFLLKKFIWLLTTISLSFINLCLISCFFNSVPKVTNLTMVTPVIKSTHLTRVTYSQISVVSQLLTQHQCEGNVLVRFQLELFPFSWARDDDQKCGHCVVQNFLTIKSPTGRM